MINNNSNSDHSDASPSVSEMSAEYPCTLNDSAASHDSIALDSFNHSNFSYNTDSSDDSSASYSFASLFELCMVTSMLSEQATKFIIHAYYGKTML